MPTYDEIKKEIAAIGIVLKEYPENLKDKVFDILISTYLGKKIENIQHPHHVQQHDATPQTNKPTEKLEGIGKKKANNRPPTKSTFQIIKDIQLRGGSGHPSFTDFYEQKKPTSNIEFNVLAIYYLTHTLSLSNIGVDHVYTCYKTVSRKIPGDLKQSIYDSSSARYGYINANNLNDMSVSTHGENLVELDLPKKKKENGK